MSSFTFLIGCECPAEIETPRENQPNSFSEIDVYNFTDISLKAFSNNVEIEEQITGNNGFESYFAGNSILSFYNSGKNLYTIPIKTNQNSEYTFFIYRIGGRFNSILSENFIDTKVRIYNLSEFELEISTLNDTMILPKSLININNVPSNIKLISNGEIEIIIDTEGFSENKINNLIIDTDLTYKYFQSF